MIIDDGNIYVTVVFKKEEKCNVLKIYKSKIAFNEKLNFKNFFSNSECVSTMAGGRMQAWMKDNEKKILLSTSADILINDDKDDSKPQDDNSIYGKILLIDENSGNYEIFSKGHRNSLGLYANINENIILNTENGPKGGDEINLILQGKNYGWDIASYGKRYKNNKNTVDYKLSHEDSGFEEPIFSFVPSIGITEIIKIPNSFSEPWQDNFLIASLHSNHLFRVKFDKKYSKILFVEKIYIGERIRDLFYLENNKQILLALEDTGSIGILEIEK